MYANANKNGGKILQNNFYSQVGVTLFSLNQKHLCYIIITFINKAMDADYKILPKRNGKTDGSFNNIAKCKFFTNYFNIQIDPKKQKIYQFDFKLPEEVPQNSNLYHEAIKSIKKFLKVEYQYLVHKGQMFWGLKASKVPTTQKCKFQYQDTEYQFQAIIRQTRELNIPDLDTEEYRQQLLQILNIDLKNTLRNSKMTELGKVGQFYPKDQHLERIPELEQIGLTILRGFKFTLVPLNRGISLQIDVCSRVLQSRNLLQIFNGHPAQQNKHEFTDATIITKYGNYRTYSIEEIDYTQTPLSQFHNEKKGAKMTYQQYFKEAYGLKVSNTRQPLLKVIGRYNQVHKGGKIEKIPEYIYLLPEFVSPTGMTDDQRAQHTTMKAIAPYTKLTPNERIENCEKIVRKINDGKGLLTIKNPMKVDGKLLNLPEIKYNTAVKPDEKGAIKNRGVLKEPHTFKDWLFVYSAGKQPQRDDEEADNAVGILKKAANTYGIKFNDPGYITVTGAVQLWIKELEGDIKKNGAPEIIVFFLSPYEEKFYPELKRYATNELKCPSQFIRKRTLGNPKGAMSAASKIAIQMNIKVGAAPWEVTKSHQYFKGRNIMYGALSISKGKKGHTLAFVGTINNQCTKVYSDIKMEIKKKEEIPVAVLQDIFVSWAKSYYQTNNKKVPDTIILYREGLSDIQTKDQLPRMEIPALDGMIKKIGEKTKVNNYNPAIICVVVNKKINSRYFAMGRENQNNPNKFTPELFNPDSGSVILEEFSINDSYDFHLAAQKVTQGTCTPTLFKVAYDTSKMPQEALINFTFEQCFNYYNWEGAVRVPACLQCADKLSKLFGESIKQPLKESPLMKKHFFL